MSACHEHPGLPVGLAESRALRSFDGLARREEYRSAAPFPHIVLDDVLRVDVFERAVDEFKTADEYGWTNYLHINERKFGNSKIETWGPTLREIAGELMAPGFVRFLEDMTGLDGLRPDPQFDGGGLHRCHRGGHLNVHTDFTAHHLNPAWQRRVNLILFLNGTWDEGWGGDLELWSADMQRCERSIAPIGNRAVIFTTGAGTFHGHPQPLACPEGSARKSMALYYFTEGSTPKARSTSYRSRPGDGARSVLIHMDTGALWLYDRVKRRLGMSDALISRLLAKIGRRRTISGRRDGNRAA